VHYGFLETWLVPAFTTGGATYLFGAGSLLEARGAAMGTSTLEEFLKAAPALSLLTMGLLDGPSVPILGINSSAAVLSASRAFRVREKPLVNSPNGRWPVIRAILLV
jgi:hypothetical protein